MHIRCNCGTMHYNVPDDSTGQYVCDCGTALTGIFSMETKASYHDTLHNKIRANILAGRLRVFTTEELLDEVKRRVLEDKES